MKRIRFAFLEWVEHFDRFIRDRSWAFSFKFFNESFQRGLEFDKIIRFISIDRLTIVFSSLESYTVSERLKYDFLLGSYSQKKKTAEREVQPHPAFRDKSLSHKKVWKMIVMLSHLATVKLDLFGHFYPAGNKWL